MAQPPLLSEEGNTLACNSFTPSLADAYIARICKRRSVSNRLKKEGFASIYKEGFASIYKVASQY
jgi:hypothetical protein